MNLTNKTNGSFFWRESGNRLFLEIDGKPTELKYTLAQNEAYRAFIKENPKGPADEAASKKETTREELLESVIQDSIDYAVRVTEIALNPKADPTISRDQVRELFNEHLDLLKIVAHTWVEKKIFNPTMSKVLDPHLAPA